MAVELTSERPFDRLFDALRDPYRRRMLVALSERNPLEFHPDGSGVALANPPGDVIDEEVLRMQQYHVHLPKLDDLGYVRWDRDAGSISRGPNWADVGPVLDLLREHMEEFHGSH